MNRWIVRTIVAGLAAMLLLGAGGARVGSIPAAMAQEGDCGPWLPFADVEGTPQAEPVDQTNVQIIGELHSVTGLVSDQSADVVVTQLTLFDGNTLAVLSAQGSIIRVDSGLVQVTVCDGSQVEIQDAETGRPTRYGAGTFDIAAGGAIIVDAGDRYFLTSASLGTDVEAGAGTPVAATPMADEAPVGSTLTVVTWGGYRLV